MAQVLYHMEYKESVQTGVVSCLEIIKLLWASRAGHSHARKLQKQYQEI